MNPALRSLPGGDDRAETGPALQFRLDAGTLVQVGTPGSGATRLLIVDRRWPRFNGRPSSLGFIEQGSGAPLFLDDEQIAFLCGRDEFRIVFDPSGKAVLPPPSKLDLTPEEEARCARARAYVDAYLVDKSRARRVLVPRIASLAAERGEPPPGFSTVIGWADLWEVQGETFGDACFYVKPNQGNRGHKLASDLVARAVEYGVLSALKMKKGTGADALDCAKAWVMVNQPDEVVPEEHWPSVRTFQERMTAATPYVVDLLASGERKARRKHRAVAERPRPELPLEEVECDHTPFDVLLVDEKRKVVFGRPDLITFRDRCTGMPLGMSIGFEALSYASFMAGLRHAFYPKDMSEYPDLEPWEAFGRPKRLYVDNALHFLGHNIRNAGRQLGFELAEFRPGEPWLKGGEERLLGLVNARAHSLPGSTFSDVAERKRFEAATAKPILTVSELRAWLTWWICDVYNVTPHQGLGFLSTLKGVPRKLWRDRIGDVRMALLPPQENFVALAGDRDMKAVTREGVRWDHIRYGRPDGCPELVAITQHPSHKKGRFEQDRRGTKHQGSRYVVRRDPFDLGHVYVTNPYDPENRTIKIGAYRSDYATGLTLHQHRVLVANADREALETAEDPEAVLMRTKRRLERYVQFLLDERESQQVQRKLARFLEDGRRDHLRSVVTTRTFSPAMSREPLNPRDPTGLAPPTTQSPDSPAPTRDGPPPPGTEAEIFETGDGLPTRVDRGAAVAAAKAARNRRLDATPQAPVSGGRPTDDAERRSRRRGAGWNADGVAATATPFDDGLVAGAHRDPTNPKVSPGRDDGPQGDVGPAAFEQEPPARAAAATRAPRRRRARIGTASTSPTIGPEEPEHATAPSPTAPADPVAGERPKQTHEAKDEPDAAELRRRRRAAAGWGTDQEPRG